MVTEWDLVCDEKIKRAHAHLAYCLGFLIGCFLSGYSSDRYVNIKLYYFFEKNFFIQNLQIWAQTYRNRIWHLILTLWPRPTVLHLLPHVFVPALLRCSVQ